MPELILAGDPDLEDLYLCEVVKPADHLAPNPLVRVLRVIRYPVQHAVLLPDVVNENAPIPEGTVCRLTALGEPHPPLRGTHQGLPTRPALRQCHWHRLPGASDPQRGRLITTAKGAGGHGQMSDHASS